MDDIERIQELVSEGRITQADGERLISVLRDIDAADFALDSASASSADATQTVSETPASPPPPEGGRATVAAEQPPAPAAAEPAATDPIAPDPIDDRRRRFEEYEQRRLERLQRDAERRNERAQRELERFERRSQREAEKIERDAERERLREVVKASSYAAAEAAREAARKAREASVKAAAAAKTVTHDAVSVATRRTEPSPGGSSGAPQSTLSMAPSGTRWVTVDVLSGDVNVHAVAGLERPEVIGSEHLSAVETDYGFLVKQVPERGSILDKFLANVRSSDITVKIPAEYGLNLRATAGDIDLHGVKYLQGRVTAGDISASGLEGIDFSIMAGDLDLEMTLKEGEHSLTGATGDIDVLLGADSDVTIDGNVSIGDAHAAHPAITCQRQTLGERISGSLGNGTARLRLRMTTGDLGIKVAGTGRDD